MVWSDCNCCLVHTGYEHEDEKFAIVQDKTYDQSA